eukprot:CAMPEP_0115648162 /NCGR_PEP_ID=MMETSP0272-20121206/39830_1 /TAXON_ID=71861 /ORGANISM="Scrippsiella trochoidea, Strain CCMP3099" /LENGTH=184 /DNA_ID=CAMNT_0003085765 /DNA_START=78 /DNA_END=628 /DNA_ORIENTATION=-
MSLLLPLASCALGLLEAAAAAEAPAFAVARPPLPPTAPPSSVARATTDPAGAQVEASLDGGLAAVWAVAAAAAVGVAAGFARRSQLVGAASSDVCVVGPVAGQADLVSGLVAMSAHRKPTKKGRKFTIIECVEQRQMVKDGVPGAGGPRGGVSRYFTEKNVRNTPALLELRKFNKYLGRHTIHR